MQRLALLLPALALACASPSSSAPEQTGGAAPSSAPDPSAPPPGPSEPPLADPERAEEAKPAAADTPDSMDAPAPTSPALPAPAPRDADRSQSRLDIAVPSINGGLNRDIIRRIASDHTDDIRDCHGRALASMPELAGKLVVELWLNESGRVTNAELTGDGPMTDRVGQCVIETIMGWSFADAGGVGSFKLAFDFAEP
jgi:outer membrane biosynthesis protein TonB